MKINNLYLVRIFLFVFIYISIISSVIADSDYGNPIEKEDYRISRDKIERRIEVGQIMEDYIIFSNYKDNDKTISLHITGEAIDVIDLESVGVLITKKNTSEVLFKIVGKEIGNYAGSLAISSDINEEIPINITVEPQINSSGFNCDASAIDKTIIVSDEIDFKLACEKTNSDKIENISIEYYLINQESKKEYLLGNDTINLTGSIEFRKIFDMPKNISEGYFIILSKIVYMEEVSEAITELRITKPIWQAVFLGFPLWIWTLILLVIVLGISTIVIIRRKIEKNKKYRMQLYLETLPIKQDRSLWLGKLAETNKKAYLDLDALTTHIVVAGATGGGKSIAAQSIIEEALINNAAVIVFDPTAQWSGMLRKCDDKKMMSFYPKFGLKPSDAKAFPGSVRQVLTETQKIVVEKYMAPGHIQVFTMNKLTPQQIDIFVANVIDSIFKSDPKEYPTLKVLLVFDEVHRLLPKFGGTGKGFLQIERACREFRKWGFGVMLVSQVLSDFVGEIKANINTEIQMRTRDEADLDRIKTKYGEEFLQSLIKASVGVGMFVNPKYNKGKPYFINFRPILHNTRRLTDEVLEQYNKYNDLIDELELKISKMEEAKLDVFDLKMELKLVKDKLMSGNFTVVDIYLEEIVPRVNKQFDSLNNKQDK